MSPWEKLLERPHSGSHFVQLYETGEAALAENATGYLWEGLRRGEAALAVVTPEHCELFLRQLRSRGADTAELIASRQLVFLDAQDTLSRFMIAGQPDWERFEKVIRAAMRQTAPRKSGEGLRAYGEMVGILWRARQFAAAIRLEQLWNKLLEQVHFSLYCAYAVDLFDTEFGGSNLASVLCAHTHLVPAQPDGSLEIALNRAMEEVLGPEAEALRTLMKTNPRQSWPVMPNAETMVFWLRENRPEHAERIIGRARMLYRASAA